MEQEKKNKIYDRLLEIKIKIEFQEIPSPQYINEKIGECHLFIEEVERYSIEISKEISVLSQAFNNAVSEYEYKKEQLFEAEDIKILPSIKDRESRADSRLRAERNKILCYKNELTDLNNLLKQLNLKIRNLNRVNTDIKIQIRILEAQIKMGGSGSNEATRSLVAEMRKGISIEDVFEDSSSEITPSQVEDPSEPLDVNGLISNEMQDFTDPVPFLPDPDQIKEESMDLPVESYELPQGISTEPEGEIIDLDQAIEIKPSAKKPEGGEEAIKVEEKAQNKSVQKEEPVVETKKKDHPKKEIDLDALLDSITIQ
jgi:hypothetical protein